MSGKRSSGWQRWKERDQALADRSWSWMWRYLAPVAAVFMLFFVVQDVGPSFRARFGDEGIRGHVTVTSEDCSGRGGCSFEGDFESDSGTVRREAVVLASGFHDESVGAVLVAYDVGNRAVVYPPGGGQDWIYTTLLAIGAVVVLVLWCLTVPFRRWSLRVLTSTAWKD